jgi:hypothetical protein
MMMTRSVGLLSISLVTFSVAAVLLVPGQAAADERVAVAIAELPPPPQPVIVLVDSTRLEPKSVKRTVTTLELHFADGHSETYRLSDIDLEASQGVPPQPRLGGGRRTQPANPRSGSSLNAYARSVKLQMPEGGTELWGESATASQRQRKPQTDQKPEVGDDTQKKYEPEQSPQLKAELAAVQAAWSDYRQSQSQVEQRCSGYFQTRTRCGGKGVASSRHSSACQDAVKQANAKLDGVEQRYARVWVAARREGIEPGKARQLVRNNGLWGLNDRVSSARARLTSLSADVRVD